MQFRVKGCRSWLCPFEGPRMAARFQGRLGERLVGESGYFLTLTYDRSAYSGPIDLYRAQSVEQHVALFMRKVGRVLGESMTGRWVRKMEFQDGEWVHFHLIVLTNKRLDYVELGRLWGHGFVFGRRLDRQLHTRYLAKYVGKAYCYPRFLLQEPKHSVKFVSVSPGFWGEPSEDDEWASGGFDEPTGFVDYSSDSYWANNFDRVWRPLGECLVEGQYTTEIKDDRGFRSSVRIGMTSLLNELESQGFVVRAGAPGWLEVDCLDHDVTRAERRCVRTDPAGSLHLINQQIPDVDFSSAMSEDQELMEEWCSTVETG